jgi:putative phage-type endonuclease
MSDLQRTESWHQDRCGHATASGFADVLAIGKNGKPLKAREDYLMRLVTERLTGTQETGLDSFSMKWGRDVEPFARAAFEAETGLIVTESGFVRHPAIKWIGASPDGLVGARAGYESKCPKNSAIHLATIQNGMPDEHRAQVQGSMLVTGREAWYFVSYDPRMPEHLRLYWELVKRDDSYIAALEVKLVEFLAEVDAMVDSFKRKEAA